jgi:hypothetical protein
MHTKLRNRLHEQTVHNTAVVKNDIVRRRSSNANGTIARPTYRIRHLGAHHDQQPDSAGHFEGDELASPGTDISEDDLDDGPDSELTHADVLAACDRLALPTQPPPIQRVAKVDISTLFSYSSPAVTRLLEHFWRADKAAFDELIEEDLPPVVSTPQSATVMRPTLTVTTS